MALPTHVTCALLISQIGLLWTVAAIPIFTITPSETTLTCSWTADPTVTLLTYSINVGTVEAETDRPGTDFLTDGTLPDFITGLKPGESYVVVITDTSNAGSPAELHRETVTLLPRAPTADAVEASGTTTNSITVSWQFAIDSKQDRTLITYQDVSAGITNIQSLTVNSPVTTALLNDLLPGHNYSIILACASGNSLSEEISFNECTKPLKPNITELKARDASRLILQWLPDAESLQSSYEVTYESTAGGSPVQAVPGCVNSPCEITVDSQFIPGSQFMVKVYALQCRWKSDEASMSANTQPLEPGALSLVARTTNSLNIQWAEPQGSSFTSFSVQVDPDDGTVTSPSKGATNVWSYLRSGLQSGQQYTFSVYTLSGNEQSNAQNIIVYTMPPIPARPTREVDGTTITTLGLVWSAPSAAGEFDKYRVKIVQKDTGTIPSNSGSPREVPKNANPRETTFTNLQPGAEYTVSIVTVISDVESEAKTADFRTKPLRPENLVVVKQETQLVASWGLPNPSTPNQHTAFQARIVSVLTSLKTISFGSTRQAVFTDLQAGTEYVVEVWTVSEDQQSDRVSSTVHTKPKPPQNLRKVGETTEEISVEWDAPADGSFEAFTVSLLLEGVASQSQDITDKTTTSHQFSGLQGATQYSVEVVSKSGEEQSSPATIIVATKPNPPISLATTGVSEDAWSLSFSHLRGNDLDKFKYVLTRVGEGSPHSTGDIVNTQNVISFGGLYPGGSYTLKLFAVRFGVESIAATLDIVMVPQPPISVAESFRGQTSLKVSWVGPTSSDYDEFVIVAVQQNNQQEVAREVVPRTTNSYEISSLSAGFQYMIKVFTSSEKVLSSSSVDILLDTQPTTVTSVEVKIVTSDSIQIAWQAPSAAAALFVEYHLNINPNHAGIPLPVVIQRSDNIREHTFLQLNPGVIYTISIQTVTSTGTKSEPAERTVITKPSPVVDLTAQTQGISTLVVRWKAGAGSEQTQFQVQYKAAEGGSVETQTVKNTPASESYSVNLQSLLPGHSYIISVIAQKIEGIETVSSDPSSIEGTTVPKAVLNLAGETTSSYSVKLSWDTSTDSRQDGYKVRYRGTHTAVHNAWSDELDTTNNPYIVEALFPGETYIFEVKATSRGNTGDARTANSNTLPLPPTNLRLDDSKTGTTSVTLMWDYDEAIGYVVEWKIRYTEQGKSNWKEDWVLAAIQQKQLNNLTPGQKYDIQVFGSTNGRILSQDPAAIVGVAKPQINSVLTEVIAETTADTVVFTYTPNTVGVFDYYFFTIEPHNADQNVNKGTTGKPEDRKVVFDKRKPGNVYVISAQAVTGTDTGALLSDPVQLQIVTLPNFPIVQSDQRSRHIVLIITKNPEEPEAQVDMYKVQCEGLGCNPVNKDLDATGDRVEFTYQNLIPFTKYIFKVIAVRQGKSSAEVIQNAETKEAAPGPVLDFRASPPTLPFEIVLLWGIPTEKNGKLQSYHITYTGSKSGIVHFGEKNITDPTAVQVVISDLRAGFEYDFTIRASTIAGGEPTTITQKMPIAKPYRALANFEKESAPKLLSDNETMLTSSSVTLEFVNPFSDKNGAVTGYTVVVTGDHENPSVSSNGVLESWFTVQSKSPGSPYQVSNPCPNFFSPNNECGSKVFTRVKRATGDRVIFTVGDQNCATGGGFCNGALAPDTIYYFSLRGYTEGQLWDDSAYSLPIKTRAKSNPTVLVAVLVTISLLIVLVVIVILIVLVRRGIICDGTKTMEATTEAPFRRSMRMSSRKKRHGETSRPMKIPEFPDHVKRMSADSDFRFSEEYEDLKQVGREQSTNAADLPVNRNKNRFTNILPYDHSRVKLLPTDDEEGSDYINANYMPGYNSKREFIVTQGPLPSTRDDYWRMVWEQHARAIVMLTRCVEKGREKCDHYWPVDSEPMFYGDLQVTILHETKCPDWIVTEFRVSKGETSRNVKHFHYIGWPDFGVPEKPQTLIQFVRLVRGKLLPEGGPIVVHCSAGVGRSGTYIALDKILQELRDKKMQIDIFGTVYEMRTYRPQMVQTEGREDEVINYGGEENEAFDDKGSSPLGSASGNLCPSNLHIDDDEGITMDPN